MSSKGVLQECHLSVSSQGVPQVGLLENVTNKFCLCSAFGFVGFILFGGIAQNFVFLLPGCSSNLEEPKKGETGYFVPRAVLLQELWLLLLAPVPLKRHILICVMRARLRVRLRRVVLFPTPSRTIMLEEGCVGLLLLGLDCAPKT